MDLMDGYTRFVTEEGKKLHYVKHIRDDLVMVWEIESTGACQSGYCRGLYLTKELVSPEVLKEAGIWEDLPASIQNKLEKKIEIVQEAVKEKMEKARQKRRKKYDFSDLPELLTCKCGRETKANYYYLQKKADEKMIPLSDLIKGYQCQTCNPTKGRKKKK